MTTTTHRNDPPALTCVETFDYLGFTCLVGRDRETRDWPMFRDGQIIGYARGRDEGCATLRTSCEEMARHTRATTADMEAEQAQGQIDQLRGELDAATEEHQATPWSAEREYRILELTAAINRGVCATPPRTVDELGYELNAVTDAIQERKRENRDYGNLRTMRDQIIAELDAAHKAARQAQDPALPWGECHKSLCQAPATHLYDLFDESIVLCCKHYSEDIIGAPCEHKCPGCGEHPHFDDPLVDQASALLTRLIAEKSHLLYNAPSGETMDERCARLSRLRRVRYAVERAAVRLGRRFIDSLPSQRPPYATLTEPVEALVGDYTPWPAEPVPPWLQGPVPVEPQQDGPCAEVRRALREMYEAYAEAHILREERGLGAEEIERAQARAAQLARAALGREVR